MTGLREFPVQDQPPVAIAGFILLLLNTRQNAHGGAACLWAVVVFISAAAAIVGGIFPYFIPFSVTVAQAAASRFTLLFMLIGVAVVLPIIAVYSLYSRGVFRGKVHEDISGENY